jgi:hypothetical protein
VSACVRPFSLDSTSINSASMGCSANERCQRRLKTDPRSVDRILTRRTPGHAAESESALMPR